MQFSTNIPAADHEPIRQAYTNLLGAMKIPLSETDLAYINQAFELAVEAHNGQRRKNGEPYILHPIEVARICAVEIGLGATSIICALLHDVVEDTEIPLADIRKMFGEKGASVALIVDGLTKLEKDITDKSPQAENFKKVIQTLLTDVRVVLIKLADRLHNMRTIEFMKPDKQKKIASETMYLYAPLAHRLGLYNIKMELQDLCMKVTQPDDYKFVHDKLAASETQRAEFINKFIDLLQDRLSGENIPFRIFGRSKAISSIWSKIEAKDVSFEEIYDIFAIRVVLDVPLAQEGRACWIVYAAITSQFTPIAERLKDWIAVPKSNGYESLHTTVVGPDNRFVEVQIRSERMDEIAEKGFAAHWRYKGLKSDKVYDDWLSKIRGALSDTSGSALELIDKLQEDLLQEEVFVYTPKGEMRTLPMGATALDFAFEIHTELGCRCQAVKVNDKLVSFAHTLANGDVVSIHTAPQQKPTEQWLKWVVTNRSRSKIRQALREEKRKTGELGKEQLDRKLKHLKVALDDNYEFLVKYFKYNNRTDLFYDITMGRFDLSQLKELRIEGSKLVSPEKEVRTHASVEPFVLETKSERKMLIVAGQPASDYSFQYATCCNPLAGDEVFAYMSANGMRIHRMDCKNATHLFANHSHRIYKSEWVSGAREAFVAKLEVRGADKVGILQDLSNIITNRLNIDIRSISIRGDEGYYEGQISVTVYNIEQLNHLIETLKTMDKNISVVRTDEVVQI